MKVIASPGVKFAKVAFFLLFAQAVAASAAPKIEGVQLARTTTEFTLVSGKGFGARKAKARVEACNVPDYADCVKKVPQEIPPEDWSDAEIRLHLQNLREFRGEPVYLFVVDNKGKASNGMALARPVMRKNLEARN